MFDFTSSLHIMRGIMIGASVMVMDIMLRPRLSEGLNELILFMIEGFGAYVVYGATKTTCYSLATFDLGKAVTNGAMGGMTIFVLDMILRPQNFGGPFQEYIKFAIQGIVLYHVYTAVNSPKSDD